MSDQAAIEADVKKAFAEAWGSCNHLNRFETWATLYYHRWRRLSPGKSTPMGFEPANSEENRALFKEWHRSGLAAHDAIMALATALERIEELEAKLEDECAS